MRTFLLDTNAASVLFDSRHKDHQRMQSFISSNPDGKLVISIITLGEIRYGYKIHSNIDAARKSDLESNMNAFPLVFDIDKHTTEPYSDIRSQLFALYGTREQKRGKIKEKRPESLMDNTTSKSLGIQENDLWIVATAIQHNFEMVTSDRMARIMAVARRTYPNFSFICF